MTLISTIKEQEKYLDDALDSLEVIDQSKPIQDIMHGKRNETEEALNLAWKLIDKQLRGKLKDFHHNFIISILEKLCEEMEEKRIKSVGDKDWKPRFDVKYTTNNPVLNKGIEVGFNQALDEQISDLKETIKQLQINE